MVWGQGAAMVRLFLAGLGLAASAYGLTVLLFTF